MNAIKHEKRPTKLASRRSAVANAVLMTSGPALKAWRQGWGIPRPLFAQIADCSERTLASYESMAQLPEKFSRPVTQSVRLIEALQELAGDDLTLKEWLKKPNPAFDNRPPLSLILSGEIDVLWSMVHQLRQGAFA